MTEETLKIIISAEIGKLKDELNKGKKEVENFKDEAKGSFDAFADIANQAGEKAKTALLGFGTAVAGIATSLLALTASTEEYRVAQSKLLTAFETAGASAETAKQTYNDLYRVLGEDDVAVEAANHLAQMTTNQKELNEWTNICQGVFATFGDSLPIEGLTEAANETAKVGKLTGGLADALNWAGVNEEEFQSKLDACNTEAEREALIRQTLNGLYSEASAAYESNASEILAQHEAEAKLAESTAALGEALAPVNTMLTELGAKILAELVPQIQSFMDENGEALETLLIGVGEAIGEIVGWIADNWDIISKVGSVILIIVAAVYALSTAVSIYSMVQAIANTQMLAVYAVIILIIAIAAIFIVFWDDIEVAMQQCAEAIKKAWGNMGKWFKDVVEDIKDAFADIKSFFTNLFTDAANAIKNAFSPIGNYFSNTYGKIKNSFSGIGSFFKTQFNNAVSGIKNAFNAIPAYFESIYNKITNMFIRIGDSVTKGLTDGVKKAINKVLSKAVDVINAAISGINGAIGFMNLVPGVNISTVGYLSVPQLAKGGVVDTATLAVVGERGKEAVMPLENNLGWLDKLAGMLNERMGGNTPIVLNVDGKRFAEISVNSINQLTKQTGSLPLVLA